MRTDRALLPLVALLVAGCSLLPAPERPGAVRPAPAQPAPAQAGAVARFREASAVWAGANIDSYTWRVESACECRLNGPLEITVVDGVATKVMTPGGEVDVAEVEGFPLTVDAVLNEAILALDGGGRVEVMWGALPGVPSRILVDRVPAAIDDELNLVVDRLDPAP